MLIQFSVANFRSIRDTQVLSLVKSKGKEDDKLQDNAFTVQASSQGGELCLLHSAAIYGANASGKSNVLLGLYAMKQVVINSHKLQEGDELKPISPFRLDAECRQAPSQFEVVFMAGGVRYQYGFAATSTQVYQEWLLAYPKGRPQEWFSREWNEEAQAYDWKLSDNIKGKKETWKESTRQNALFLSTAVQLNAEVLLPVFNWFKRDLRTILSIDRPGAGYTASLCEQEAQKQKILALLKAADIAVHDMQLESRQLLERMSENQKNSLSQEEFEQLKDALVPKVGFVRQDNHGVPQQFDLEKDESDGTQKLFALLGPCLDVLENGWVLLADELHGQLHPLLVKFLIALFHNPQTNPKHAQLIFTTHETSVLSPDVLRRDQIWFVEKGTDHASTLYPLSDFSPRKGQNLEQAYLSGRFGAVPILSSVSATSTKSQSLRLEAAQA